jgi:hypothetical protein
MITLTDKLLLDGMSSNGGWSDKQITLLGVWKTKGWRSRLLGSEVSEDRYQKFLDLKSEHLKNKKSYNRRNKRKTSTLLDKAIELIIDNMSDGESNFKCPHDHCYTRECEDCDTKKDFNSIVSEYAKLTK